MNYPFGHWKLKEIFNKNCLTWNTKCGINALMLFKEISAFTNQNDDITQIPWTRLKE